MDSMNVLISLYKGYGLGDAVQMSAVLRHVADARPNWRIDYQAEEGRHQVGRGIVCNTFAYGKPPPSNHYDSEVQIVLYDTWANWHDRPNTRVSSCLHERFGLPWKSELGRYRVWVSREAQEAASILTSPRTSEPGNVNRKTIRKRMVAIHYQGDSAPERKNLSHEQAARVCKEVESLGYTPLIIDWRDASPLSKSFRTTGFLPMSRVWGASAEMNCAVISQCAAFVGIDSGPGKCASATDTPALIIWTGHHPAPFHDPASNTSHLVPKGYHNLDPVCADQGVIDWFESHHDIWEYRGDPSRAVDGWLREKLP